MRFFLQDISSILRKLNLSDKRLRAEKIRRENEKETGNEKMKFVRE